MLDRHPRPEPPRLDAPGPPRRLQRREALGRRDQLRHDADEGVRSGHASSSSRPEQETNVLELLVNVTAGRARGRILRGLLHPDLEERFTFSLFNRSEQQYPILYADRARKRLVLARPYRETSARPTYARASRSRVGRPADIYSLGATFYYLISGAYANPKTLYDAFHKFIEYERADENNTIESYLRHEYSVINSLRAPKTLRTASPEVAPADRFFSYKQLPRRQRRAHRPERDADHRASCMIRNKPDSYCQAHDLDTRGVSDLVVGPDQPLLSLRLLSRAHGRPTSSTARTANKKKANGVRGNLPQTWQCDLSIIRPEALRSSGQKTLR